MKSVIVIVCYMLVWLVVSCISYSIKIGKTKRLRNFLCFITDSPLQIVDDCERDKCTKSTILFLDRMKKHALETSIYLSVFWPLWMFIYLLYVPCTIFFKGFSWIVRCIVE